MPFAPEGFGVRRNATLDVEMSGAGTAEGARYALNGAPLDNDFIPFGALRDGANTLAVSFASANTRQ